MTETKAPPITKADEIKRLREQQPGIAEYVDGRFGKGAKFFEQKLRAAEKLGNAKRIEGAQIALRYYQLLAAEKAEKSQPVQEAVKEIPISKEEQAPAKEAVPAPPISKEEPAPATQVQPAPVETKAEQPPAAPSAEEGGIRELVEKAVGDNTDLMKGPEPVDAKTREMVAEVLEEKPIATDAGKGEAPKLDEIAKLRRSRRWRAISHALAMSDDEKVMDACVLALGEAKRWDLVSAALAATENGYAIGACISELKGAKKWPLVNSVLRETENEKTAAACVSALKEAELWELLGMTLTHAAYPATVDLCLEALIGANEWEQINHAFRGTKSENTRNLILKAYEEHDRQPPPEDEEGLPAPEDV